MEIRDPVHGFIYINEFERNMINSIPFQRLRNIKQLGMTYYVYPGAMHTRFEHSLGVVHVATEMFNIIGRKIGKNFNKIFPYNYEEENMGARLLKTLRIAALFHDIGHPPFSHTTEDLFPIGIQSHEDMTVKILREKYSDVFEKSSIRREGIFLDDVIYLISPKDVKDLSDKDALPLYLIREILSGPIDADRIDYLTRDSLYTGVIYGKFDWMRLINTLTVVPYKTDFLDLTTRSEFKDISPEKPRPSIGIEKGGIHSVEGLLLARHFMFTQVYFHPVRRIYDLMIKDFIREILPGQTYPADVDEYLEWDDIKVIGILREEAKSPSNESTKILARRILKREHPRKIFEVNGPYFKEFEDGVREELSKKFGLDHKFDIYVDTTRNVIYKNDDESVLYVIDDDVSEEVLDKWDNEILREKIDQGKISVISKESQLLSKLPDIQITRVYAYINKKEERERAEGMCREIYKNIISMWGEV